jgi:hypothetical protein
MVFLVNNLEDYRPMESVTTDNKQSLMEQMASLLVQKLDEKRSPAWQRAEGKNPEGGLNAKGRASAKAQGHNLKPPVSAKQAKKSKKSAGRRRSFCARMKGMKRKLTSKKTAGDRNSRINKSLRKWDC